MDDASALDAPAPGSIDAHPVRLVLSDDPRVPRLRALARPVLVYPHFWWVAIWGTAAFAAAVVHWFVLLARAEPSRGLHAFTARFTRYYGHVSAYARLLAAPFPHFSGDAGDYPTDVELGPPSPQRRWTVALRLVLFLPAAVFANVLQSVGYVVAVVAWVIALVLGRVPKGLRELAAFLLRYELQTIAYALLVTDRYPGLATPRPHGPVLVEPPTRTPAVGRYV